MVRWSETWLLKKDKNDVLIKYWCHFRRAGVAYCTFCGSEISFSKQGCHALLQHSRYKTHQEISELRFGNGNMKLVPAESASTIAAPLLSKRPVSCELPVSDKMTNAEALWTFKVAASDFSLHSCHNLSDLFGKKMFADSPTAQGFNLGRSKISYGLSDGFAPLLLKQICYEVRKSNSGFTLLTRRQMLK